MCRVSHAAVSQPQVPLAFQRHFMSVEGLVTGDTRRILHTDIDFISVVPQHGPRHHIDGVFCWLQFTIPLADMFGLEGVDGSDDAFTALEGGVAGASVVAHASILQGWRSKSRGLLEPELLVVLLENHTGDRADTEGNHITGADSRVAFLHRLGFRLTAILHIHHLGFIHHTLNHDDARGSLTDGEGVSTNPHHITVSGSDLDQSIAVDVIDIGGKCSGGEDDEGESLEHVFSLHG